MAPKRSAPPPQPPQAPVASSEETASGSDVEESEEEEEEIAQSTPAAAAAPKSSAAPLQGPESEGSDEDEDEEEDEEEEEEDEKAHHVAPPSATKNQPPPQLNQEESESSGEEEEETDDEAPQPKTAAPVQEAVGKGAKPSTSSEEKKPAGASFQRTWSTDDEVRILEAMAAYRGEHGTLPQPEALEAALAGKLDKSGFSRSELQMKVKSLKRRYTLAAKKGEPPSKEHDRRLFDLSKEVWVAAATAAANGGAQRGLTLREICELYPYLAEEVKAHEKEQPGLFKRVYSMIDDDKARALDLKIKKHRMVQMKLHLRRHELTKEVTKTLMDLVD